MPDFILECRPVKVKSDGFEAQTGGVDTMSCHTFITLVNLDPDTAPKIIKTLLQDLCNLVCNVYDLGIISLLPTSLRA